MAFFKGWGSKGECQVVLKFIATLALVFSLLECSVQFDNIFF